MIKSFLNIFIVLTFISASNSMSEITYQEKDFTNSVSLQGINKITARVSSFDLVKDDKMSFGNLEVQLVRCWKSPPEEEPENKALIRIWEKVPGEERKEIFFGWMFSSSPALSALEHPVYDIAVKSCQNIKKTAESKKIDRNKSN